MLNIIICDDEKVLRSDLKRILEAELGLMGVSYRITEYGSGEEMLTEYPNIPGQKILYLDIKLDNINGIDTARRIRRLDASAVIIFVTVYPEFVFQGYEVRALDYILKPYEKEKIIRSLQNALSVLDLTKESCFFLDHRKGSQRIPFDAIPYFYSRQHKVYIVTTEGTQSFYGKLGDLEGSLPSCFVRIHNRYFINLKYLDSLEKNCAIVGNTALPVSRSYKQSLSIAYARYMLE